MTPCTTSQPAPVPTLLETLTQLLPDGRVTFRLLAPKAKAVEDELFRDIIPLVEVHYNISRQPQERGIAGLSMGGLQAIETGIVHLDYFRWIGAFSPGVRSAAFSDDFKNALPDPDKINQTLLLFDIVAGTDDRITGEDVARFEIQLKKSNIQHTYTVVADGTHSMFVWRAGLYNFLQRIFNR